MSRASELARAEADEVEREQPETETEEEEAADEDERTEQQEHEPTEAEPEARGATAADFKRFEAENTRHEKALAKIMGADFAAFTACETCGGVGFAVKDATPPPQLERDPKLIACDACHGIGYRSTGSLHEQYGVIPCTVCTGTGYRDVDAIKAEQAAAAYAAQPPQPPPAPLPVWNPATNSYELPGQNAYNGLAATGVPGVS